ncbi:AprI/Inh family metalloprotease inhibitor [Stappia indica]|uniref:AprI/Inh family metalloprotease inhibitor n=1 Tax=Stappia indica TaxID=538381 RepID=UPI001CD4D543|nr:AprI/Inh family metalloprotease inhibitor [Stappia indica]MCA1299357.1 protease inhibitor Inh/omp19 family protein [Stappia indica]
MKKLAVLVSGLLVTACQSTGPGPSPYATGTYYRPSSMPYNSTTWRTHNMTRKATLSSKTKSWVGADGTRHTKSFSTSASVSVNPDALGATMAAMIGAAAAGSGDGGYRPTPSSSDLAGSWQLDIDGKQCKLTLNRPVGRPTGYASSFGCFGSDLGQVTGWSLRGYEVVLTGTFDKRQATLHRTAHNRLDGTTAGGTRITAWR